MLYSFHVSGFFDERKFMEECADDEVASMVANAELEAFYEDNVELGNALSFTDIAENMYEEYLSYWDDTEGEQLSYREYLDEYSGDIDNAIVDYMYDNIDIWYEPVTKEPEYDDDCYEEEEEEYVEESYDI